MSHVDASSPFLYAVYFADAMKKKTKKYTRALIYVSVVIGTSRNYLVFIMIIVIR